MLIMLFGVYLVFAMIVFAFYMQESHITFKIIPALLFAILWPLELVFLIIFLIQFVVISSITGERY